MSDRVLRLVAFFGLVLGVTVLTWAGKVVTDVTWTQAQVTVLWGIGVWLIWDRLDQGDRR